MERTRIWLVVVALTGVVTSLLAASLLWLLVTHPIRVSEMLSRGY